MLRIGLVVSILCGQANAAPSCADQVKAYAAWQAPIQADIKKGAVVSDKTDELVSLPLQTGSAPVQSAMTLVVDKAGLHDGNGPAVAAGEAKSLIAKNRNIEWARTNKNAISHGIVIHATRDAPAASVKAAIDAGLAAKERVWLTYKPSDATAAAPATSAVTDELAKIDAKDISKLVEVVTREFGKCDGMMAMMRELGGETEATRMKTMVTAPPAALEKCACKTDPAVAASVMWKLAFQSLAVFVEVKSTAALPWGDAKATWGDRGVDVAKAVK